MISSLLALTEKRLERVQLDQNKLHNAILQLQQQHQDIRQRIAILVTQVSVYEKSEELTQMDFWERQRQKAVVLAQRRARWLKLELQQQNEIEELFVHVDNQITAK